MEVEGDAAAAADRGDPRFGAVLARAGQTVAQASSTERRCGTGLRLPEPLGRAVLPFTPTGCPRGLWASGYRSSIAVATSPAAASGIAVEARSSTSSRAPGISRASAAQDNALETFRPSRPLRHAAA